MTKINTKNPVNRHHNPFAERIMESATRHCVKWALPHWIASACFVVGQRPKPTERVADSVFFSQKKTWCRNACVVSVFRPGPAAQANGKGSRFHDFFAEKNMVSDCVCRIACFGLRVPVKVINNQNIPIVDNFPFSFQSIRVEMYNFVRNYTMVWTVV